MSQSGRHNQLQRQPDQDRQARTSGTRTNPKGPDKTKTRSPRIRRVKPRVRPAMPQTGGARAARISASGCKAVEAGSRERLKLRIAPLSDRTTALNISAIAHPSRGPSTLAVVMMPTRFSCPPTWSRLVPALLRAKKKPAWSNTQRHTTTPAYSSTGPPGTGRVAL